MYGRKRWNASEAPELQMPREDVRQKKCQLNSSGAECGHHPDSCLPRRRIVAHASFAYIAPIHF